VRHLVLIAAILGAGGLAVAQTSDRPADKTTVDNSTSSPPAVHLPTPLLDPPPGLVDVPDTPGGRAARHADVVEVLDVLGVRIARAGPDDCVSVPSVAMGLAMIHAEATLHLTTARSLLVGIEGGGELEDRTVALGARLDHLGGLATEAREGARGCDPATSPSVFLDGAAIGSVLGRVAVYARTDGPSLVVWADGVPVAATGEDGWTVFVLDAGEHTLCAADPREPACAPGFVVDARMGAAFDLR